MSKSTAIVLVHGFWGGAAHWAKVITELSRRGYTSLHAVEMPLTALADIWRGEYSTLWRQPPGQTGRLSNGNTGPAAAWATQQLDRLQAQGELPASAASFDQKVRAFQTANGLDAEGIAGPITFMLINRAAGVAEPRLGAPATP